MIGANVRQTLGRDDAQLALRLISRGSCEEYERGESLLRDRGLDALLDDPRLMPALCESRQGAVASFPLFAYVVVRHALRGAGEDDRMLADYLASLLMHFGMRGRAMKITDVDDETYSTLADIAEDLDGPDPRRTFLVGAHLGNYALWLSGLFPDYIESRRWRRGGPDLGYYEAMGRRGFEAAASHRLAAEHGMDTLFSAAAERFPLLRIALNSVSDSLLFPNVHSPDRLLRQVRDEARWKLMS